MLTEDQGHYIEVKSKNRLIGNNSVQLRQKKYEYIYCQNILDIIMAVILTVSKLGRGQIGWVRSK